MIEASKRMKANAINTQPELTKSIHIPVPFFDLALEGIELGYWHCFRSFLADIFQYNAPCDMCDFQVENEEGGLGRIQRAIPSFIKTMRKPKSLEKGGRGGVGGGGG
ncbi:hypothetical protein BGZ60DRAFT_518395 [Tricladium varicosporioides]|nr:hypothetical protein BGZ60DRAFT_518395 [Hymenoscyphus varicosporioides]